MIAKTFADMKKIIINAKEKTVSSEQVSYMQVVELAGKVLQRGLVYTVTYRKAFRDKQGVMSPNSAVKIKNGTIFDVVLTNDA